MRYFGQHYIFICKNAKQYFCSIFLQFWAFFLMFVAIFPSDQSMEIWLIENWCIFQICIYEIALVRLKKIYLCAGLYCLWNIVFLEKIWTLFTIIPNFFNFSNFRNTFASHISCTNGWKEFFLNVVLLWYKQYQKWRKSEFELCLILTNISS